MDHVIRFVVTYKPANEPRKMLGARQGRNTYLTYAEAQKFCDAIKDNPNNINSPFDLSTLEPRACKCYPVHHDPQEYYFD